MLTRIRPNGPDRIETFEAAGGVRGVMKQLAVQLDRDVLTASGQRLGSLIDETPAPDAACIRPLGDPFAHEPGLMIIRGSLAPDGALVKLAAVPAAIRRFRGEAKVFEDEALAIEGLKTGVVCSGQVIVLRMLGPKGGPGTVFAASFMAALVGAGLGSEVAVVTDGELSGLNSGITIGQVMPEAAEGGPLAAVRDGDAIEIDLTARRIELVVPADEIARRLEGFTPPVPSGRYGWLHMYGALVQPLSRGAVLGARPILAGKSG